MFYYVHQQDADVCARDHKSLLDRLKQLFRFELQVAVPGTSQQLQIRTKISAHVFEVGGNDFLRYRARVRSGNLIEVWLLPQRSNKLVPDLHYLAYTLPYQLAFFF